MNTTPWDNLSHYFVCDELSQIDPDVADNVLIAWPSLLKGIQLIQKNGAHLSALDYGCGGGDFCKKLFSKGYSVVGCDSSAAMIVAAKKKFPNMEFYQCNSEKLHHLPYFPFDLITSIMVIPFVQEMRQLFVHLNDALKPGGILAFAVFNPEYVTKNHGAGKPFHDFKTIQQGTSGFLDFGNIQLAVFIRSLEEYDRQITSLGFTRVFCDTPPFSEKYLTQYQTKSDTSSPEFLILVYQKTF